MNAVVVNWYQAKLHGKPLNRWDACLAEPERSAEFATVTMQNGFWRVQILVASGQAAGGAPYRSLTHAKRHVEAWAARNVGRIAAGSLAMRNWTARDYKAAEVAATKQRMIASFRAMVRRP